MPPAPGGAVQQHCYRHPDRAAGVTCQRCNQPICPSCMITASVGFQCPNCAKSGAAASRVIRVRSQQAEPILTYALIAINAAVFLWGVALSGSPMSGSNQLVQDFALSPDAVAHGEWWRLITSGFLHFGLLHIGFNMYALYVLGGALERIVGRAQFALVYFVSMLGGSFLVVAIGGTNDATAGASGAVFGLFGAFAVLELSRGINPMKTGIGATIMLNLVFTIAVPGISIGGHLGGLVTGAVCGAALFGINPDQARNRHRHLGAVLPGLAVLGLALGVGAVFVARIRVGM